MNIKDKIKSRQVVSGQWIQSGSAVVAEIMAAAEIDFIAADMEHGVFGERELTGIVRAAQNRCAVLARVKENSTIAIRRALDIGCQGVIVPLVNTKVDAQKAVSSVLYPPEGVRGFAFCRANLWGVGSEEYFETFNKRVIVIVMIETRQAVENIESILQVDGLDGVLVGGYDLSGSYGVAGQLAHPAVIMAKEKIVLACKRYNVAVGEHIVKPSAQIVAKAVESGYTFLPLGMDTVFLTQSVERVCGYIRDSLPTK